MYKRYHLIGIGGIGMSAIAQLLLRRGIYVSGSDLKASALTEELKKMGATVFIGHAQENIHGVDIVVYSSAIKRENPELKEAAKKNIPAIKRAEALAMLMQDKAVVTVTGSHGKTTTASLASYLLLEAGLSPTLAVGGIIKNIDTNASIGNGRFFVAEADESDGSFLCYKPDYSIITNIDYEHLDYYKEFKNAIGAFKEFLNNTKENGCLFASSDDAVLKGLVEGYKKRYVFFGLKEGAHIYPKNILIKGLASEFDCFYKDKLIGRFNLSLGGMHNISNSLSVIALGLELGIDLKFIKKTLLDYRGAGRRLEVKFQEKGLLLIDDYAHHPTEIKATLAAIRNLRSERVIAVFQPHRYTRTKLLLNEFGKCFESADYIIITDIYAASEPPLEGVTGRLLSDKIRETQTDKEVYFLPKEEIIRHLLKVIKPSDIIITLGAGDIVKTCDELAKTLKGKGPAERAA